MKTADQISLEWNRYIEIKRLVASIEYITDALEGQDLTPEHRAEWEHGLAHQVAELIKIRSTS